MSLSAGYARAYVLAHRAPNAYEIWGKPTFDRVVALVLFAAFLPLMALVGAVVWAFLGRPVFFTQQRIGKDGEPFMFIKFRTMKPDRRSEQIAIDFPDRRTTHKTLDDPRHTPVGEFLRRWSLDELPQLANVLMGDMSLVGPRPELVEVVEGYAPWQHSRHLVKPGITGLWQVKHRAPGSLMSEFTETDLEYVERMSFITDVRLLVATIPATLGGRGS